MPKPKQIDLSKRISKTSTNVKRALRQLFWRSTDLTFLQIIIVASRPTLPFSWGGGRRFATGRRQIKDRCRETMDLHQALQTSDKSTTTASYAFNHIPKTQDTLSTQHSASTFDIATFDDRHAITKLNHRTSKIAFGQIIRMEINNDSIN